MNNLPWYYNIFNPEIFKNERKESMTKEEVLEQESCDYTISRQAVLDLCDSKDPDYKVIHFKEDVECLPSVNPQPKTGCEGCIYEKTGNNSTYPCSRCGRCYTDKYKAESEG